MAVSDVSICNLALQKLGATRIVSLTEDSRNARSCNACYELIRDRELRAHPWKFAIKRVVLAPAVGTPVFDYTYAFPLPSDTLRVILPPRLNLDWVIEGQSILTNDGTVLNVRYIARITDPTQFDALFDESLAAKLAWHLCEELTQSNEKKQAALGEYTLAIRDAKRTNAIEKTPELEPLDGWDAARMRNLLSRNDLNGPWPQQ